MDTQSQSNEDDVSKTNQMNGGDSAADDQTTQMDKQNTWALPLFIFSNNRASWLYDDGHLLIRWMVDR